MPNGADYLARYDFLAKNANSLEQRTTLAAIDAATDVANEDPATVNHTDRLKLSGAVLKNPDNWGRTLTRVIVAEASTTVVPPANPTQAQLDTADTALKLHLTTNWTAYATAYAAWVSIAPTAP